jgi:hypothetical protein
MFCRVGYFGNNQASACLFCSFENVLLVLRSDICHSSYSGFILPDLLQKLFDLILHSFQESLLTWMVVICYAFFFILYFMYMLLNNLKNVGCVH